MERGAANQYAVDFRFLKEGAGVGRLYAPAIEHRDIGGCRTVAGDPVSNGAMYGRGVVGGSRFSGADGPHRLVGHYDSSERLRVQAVEHRELPLHDRHRLARFPLLQFFSHAQHRYHAAREQCTNLFSGFLIGLSEHVAPF